MIKRAAWIACPDCRSVEAPVIRRHFSLSDIRSAEIEITGLGYFYLFINGHRVGDDFFVPAQSDYGPRDFSAFYYPIHSESAHRVYYLTYDITSALSEGDNVLEIALGNGFFNQREINGEGPQYFSDELCAVYALSVTHSDGSTEELLSDGSESYTFSEVTYNSLYLGEEQDFSRHDETQKQVKIISPFAPLLPQTCPPDRIIRRVTPVFLGKCGDRYIYDVGENITGRLSFTHTGKSGDVIEVRYAEQKDENGLSFGSCGSEYFCKIRNVYRIQTDRFIFDGGEHRCATHFTFHAFRYFDATEPIDAVCEIIHADTPVKSGFTSSDPVLNWYYEAFLRTQLANMHGGVPSDCPHRERFGYTGDGQIVCDTAMTLLSADSFYEKWIGDILDCQDNVTGHVLHTAPFMGGGGGPAWGCAIAIVPWVYYRHTGDIAMLERCYEPITSYLSYLSSRSEDGLVTHEEENGWCLGDWASLDPIAIPPEFVNSCYYVHVLELACRMAELLGKDGTAFARDAEKVRDSLHRHFYDEKTHRYADGVNGADAFALFSHLPDASLSALLSRYREHPVLDTGFIGTKLLCDIVSCEDPDLYFTLITGHERGNFGYMMDRGATTLWEYLADDTRSNSHPMFGAAARNLFSDLLGIRQTEESVRYDSIRIEPHLPSQLDSASGFLDTHAGRIAVSFDRKKDGIHFSVTVPHESAFSYGGVFRTLPGGTTDFVLAD